MKCEWLKECPFFNTLNCDATNALKEVYCHDNPTICARRHVAMAVGRNNVPADLAPNHQHRVQSLIDKAIGED